MPYLKFSLVRHCKCQNMWTHLGAPKLCSQMRASNQALQYPCAPSTCWIASPIAENVQTTDSSMPSAFMIWKLPRQLNRVLTAAASFTLMGCRGAASMRTACREVVTLATKYCFSEMNLLLRDELLPDQAMSFGLNFGAHICCVYSIAAYV